MVHSLTVGAFASNCYLLAQEQTGLALVIDPGDEAPRIAATLRETTIENIADFVSAYIIGNLLQMAFRFWAFRRWVFPDEMAKHAPDMTLEATITAGGFAEAYDELGDDPQLGDSSEPKVSKTS